MSNLKNGAFVKRFDTFSVLQELQKRVVELEIEREAAKQSESKFRQQASEILKKYDDAMRAHTESMTTISGLNNKLERVQGDAARLREVCKEIVLMFACIVL
jgi:chromosome segregation ATPase